MKYIVFWVAVSVLQVPCPTTGPYVDQYGITQEQNMTLSILCLDTEQRPMQKEFDTLKDAQAFVDQAQKECGKAEFLSHCENFEIKEVKNVK